MATNLRAPVTEDIWHLSIDDLFAPLPEKPRLGGPGPFVINLSSSTASIRLPALNLAGCEAAHAYEIQRNEDGRTRYRLRLGPFETEEAADVLLDMVREIYPSALAATAAPDDLKAIASIRAKAAAAAEARRPAQSPKKPEPPIATASVVATAPVVAAAPLVAPTPAPIAVAIPQVAAAPPAAAPAVVTAQPVASPQPLVLEEAVSFNVDISFADIEPPKMPEPPVVNVRAEAPLQSPAPKFVEPPVVTERAEVKIAKAASPPTLTERAPARAPVAPQPVSPPPAAPPAVVWTPPAITAQVSAPQTTVAPAKKAAPIATTSYVSPVKKPASIWSSLPVAARSTVQKPQSSVGKPAMSVSAPLVRRPAAANSAVNAAKAVAPAKPAAPVAAAPAVAATPPAKPAVTAGKPATSAPKTPHPQAPPATAHRESAISLESTQTMRAITKAELEDENALPWFVIELATSNEAFDPDTVPNLDLFAEYRLYSVAELGGNDIVHALRVGFFSAEIAAKAVASYLSQYYDKPAIKRVSLAERERFQEQTVEARKDVGATGRHAVIEITDDLVARRKRSTSITPSP
jgi:SPOR domain